MKTLNEVSVGFIGLGQMGGNMVEWLQQNNVSMNVMDRDELAVKRVMDNAPDNKPAASFSTAKELAQKSDVVMLCLTTSEVVESIVYGDNGLLAGMDSGKLLIDFGTSIPASTRKIGGDMNAIGVSVVDAAIGRTPSHAREGLLNLMVGAAPDAFLKAEPFLKLLGENVFHLGDLGSGQTAKLINNFMGMTTVCAMSQAFAVANRAGIDGQELFNIMSTGPSSSPFMQFCKNFAVDGVSDLGFSIANANKDLGYFVELMKDLNTQSPIAEATSGHLANAVEVGMGQGNVPEIYNLFLINKSK